LAIDRVIRVAYNCQGMLNWAFLKKLNDVHIRPSMRRRLQFATLNILNQILLIALAIAWIVHICIIAVYGAVMFEENNSLVLWSEIVTLAVILIFSICIFIVQIQRFGEKREDTVEGRRESDRRIEKPD
jgi:protein-S-isoprenylcysteine O-methyltransferase Ste14